MKCQADAFQTVSWLLSAGLNVQVSDHIMLVNESNQTAKLS